MNQPEFLQPGDQTQTVGHAFWIPIVTKGWPWLPATQAAVRAIMTIVSARAHPIWPPGKRLLRGFLSMQAVLGSEWTHNLAHDAVRINIFLSTASWIPVTAFDDRTILKWSLVQRGLDTT